MPSCTGARRKASKPASGIARLAAVSLGSRCVEWRGPGPADGGSDGQDDEAQSGEGWRARAKSATAATAPKGNCVNPNCTCVMVDPYTKQRVDGYACRWRCQADSKRPLKTGECRCAHGVCA